jgi:hypothetical protein
VNTAATATWLVTGTTVERVWGRVRAGSGAVIEHVHSDDDCYGRPCPFHRPTNHHMRTWPLHWRDDRRIFERICRHGTGHPDPDQHDYWRAVGELHQGIHGCCEGCCCTPGGIHQ